MATRFTGEIDLDATPAPGDLVFAFHGGRLLVREEGAAAAAPNFSDVEPVLGGRSAEIFLGRLDGRPCFAIRLDTEPEPPAGFKFAGLRELFGRLGDQAHGVAGRAFQTIEWFSNHAHCGRCGTATVLVAGERARGCPSCSATYYPRINPAVIMLVVRDDRMLLARNRLFRGPFYSCLAGFVEPGESLEEAVAREVEEETAIQVADVRYFASQPWPFPSQLMIGFTASYAGGEIHVQDSEILDAGWFGRSDPLPELPGRFSLARRLIDAFLDPA
ncbi:MAG: NAD(+) diphosphatase [Candidatus Dormibacteraceae bacterium]